MRRVGPWAVYGAECPECPSGCIETSLLVNSKNLTLGKEFRCLHCDATWMELQDGISFKDLEIDWGMPA